MSADTNLYWITQLFNYCERGSDPGLWAEPFNALTNLCFLAAASVATMRLNRQLRNHHQSSGDVQRPPRWQIATLVALIALVFCIAIGSFLFHTTATRWAKLGDVLPIGLFMLAYVAFVLRAILRLPIVLCGLGLLGFIAAGALAGGVSCGGKPCFNGSLAYLPALIMLWGVAGLLWRRSDPDAGLFLAAGAIFALSLSLRTVDFQFCQQIAIFGHVTGTHFLWHILNAALLYLLLRAAINRVFAPGCLHRPHGA